MPRCRARGSGREHVTLTHGEISERRPRSCVRRAEAGGGHVQGTLQGILGSLGSLLPAPVCAPCPEDCQAQRCASCPLDAGCGLNIGSRRGCGEARPWVAQGGPEGGRGGRPQPQVVGSRPGGRELLGEEGPGTKEVRGGGWAAGPHCGARGCSRGSEQQPHRGGRTGRTPAVHGHLCAHGPEARPPAAGHGRSRREAGRAPGPLTHEPYSGTCRGQGR